MKEKKSSFTGSLGFVLAAAGSAVGVGNIWRFPYLCAKDGGGLFLIVYLILVLTFGFVLLTTDIAIGRKTKQNALKAFGTLHSKWRFLGYLTFLVPALIMTYYSVIGGWIMKYFCEYVVSDGSALMEDSYFISFITSKAAPIVFMLLFLALTAWIVYRGVEKGIEKFSRFIMPGLILLILGIAVFSLTLSHEDANGTVRTGLQGLKVYLLPDVSGLTVKRFLEILLDAMSQLFFSLSVSMGIMVTYRIIALAFFLMMGFAALTSCVSVMETLVANCMEIFHKSRQKMCAMIGIYSLVTAVLICLGYNVLYFELKLPNGATAQLLDVMDYISNSFLMPFISLLTSILIGWVVGPKVIVDEVERNGEHFTRAKLYRFMIRYVVPVVMLVLFLVSTGLGNLF